MSTQTLTWTELRPRIIEQFRGDLPRAETEQHVMDAFQRSPLAVLSAIDTVAESVASGKARSGWAVLAKHLERLESVGDVTVEVDARQSKVAAAERWIVNVGYLIDREDELVDALFGHSGPLRDFHSDGALRSRLVALWERERPRGVVLEQRLAMEEAEHRRKREELAAVLCVCAFVRRMAVKA